MVRRLLPGWFPHLPDQTQFNRRLRRLTPQITKAQLMVAELIAEGEVCLVDGTLISCANYPGCAQSSDFAPDAAYGYCPSKSRFVWGMRLVVICDRKGVPVGYDLVGPKTGEERDSAFRLASAHPHSHLFADGGFWGREYEQHDGTDRHPADHPRETQARAAAPERDHQGANPAGDRVSVRQPQASDAPRRTPRQDHLRPCTANRATPARA